MQSVGGDHGESPTIIVHGQRVGLGRDRTTIGKAPDNDVVIADSTVSRIHAVIEAVGQGHMIVDLGSRNGTYVNGERVFSHRVLHSGDEVRIGKARLRYDVRIVGATETSPVEPPPAITAREKDVLVELCRPLLSGTVFSEPSGPTYIAKKLFISEAAVRMHLSRLARKFGIDPDDPRRRSLLAGAALDRGAISTADLKS